MSLSEQQKWVASVYVAILYFLLAHPLTFKITNKLFKTFGFSTVNNGKPTFAGLILHTGVFILGSRALMEVPLPGK